MDENNNIIALQEVKEEVISQGIVKKVLCIDMNFIMFPCIKLYFDEVNPEENSSLVWEKLSSRKDIDNFLSMDTIAFTNILNLIMANEKSISKYKITEHQKDIVDELVLDDPGIMYEITNIDFYHDLFIDPKKDKQKLKHFNKYNDMNWIGYIDAKEKLYSYNWISAPNSPVLDPNIKFNTESVFHISYHMIDNYVNHGFDEIYISYSPNLYPYKYRYMVNILDIVLRCAMKDKEDNK